MTPISKLNNSKRYRKTNSILNNFIFHGLNLIPTFWWLKLDQNMLYITHFSRVVNFFHSFNDMAVHWRWVDQIQWFLLLPFIIFLSCRFSHQFMIFLSHFLLDLLVISFEFLNSFQNHCKQVQNFLTFSPYLRKYQSTLIMCLIQPALGSTFLMRFKPSKFGPLNDIFPSKPNMHLRSFYLQVNSFKLKIISGLNHDWIEASFNANSSSKYEKFCFS